MVEELNQYFKVHNLLPDLQSAYRVGNSIETALVRVHDDIVTSKDDKNLTLMVPIDLSAAFDRVDHRISLDVLKNKFRVQNTAFSWFTSFLYDRSFRVTIGNSFPDASQLTSCVPQGSCAGPVL